METDVARPVKLKSDGHVQLDLPQFVLQFAEMARTWLERYAMMEIL